MKILSIIKVDGKSYDFIYDARTYTSARKLADGFRKKGFSVRVKPYKKSWYVYVKRN